MLFSVAAVRIVQALLVVIIVTSQVAGSAVAFSATERSESPTHHRLVIVAGQSNAVGFPSSASEPVVLPGDADVGYSYSIAGGSWGPVESGGLGGLSAVGSFWGPEIRIGQRLNAHKCAGESIVVVKVARGSTSLHTDWRPGTGPQYLKLVERVQQVANALSASGDSVEVEAMYWAQGGTDMNSPHSQNYQQNLAAFLGSVRDDLGAPAMKVVIQSSDLPIVNNAGPSFDPVGLQRVTDAQAAVAAEDPHAALVRTDDVSRIADGVHLDGAGLNAMGNRASWHMLSMRDSNNDSVSDMVAIDAGADPCAAGVVDLAFAFDGVTEVVGSPSPRLRYGFEVSNQGATDVAQFFAMFVGDQCQQIDGRVRLVHEAAGHVEPTDNPLVVRWTGHIEPNETVSLVVETDVVCSGADSALAFGGVFHAGDDSAMNNVAFVQTVLS